MTHPKPPECICPKMLDKVYSELCPIHGKPAQPAPPEEWPDMLPWTCPSCSNNPCRCESAPPEREMIGLGITYTDGASYDVEAVRPSDKKDACDNCPEKDSFAETLEQIEIETSRPSDCEQLRADYMRLRDDKKRLCSELAEVRLENEALREDKKRIYAEYIERGIAMKETGDIVRALYEPKIQGLTKERDELLFELEAKQRPLSKQVLELTIERDALKAQAEKLAEAFEIALTDLFASKRHQSVLRDALAAWREFKEDRGEKVEIGPVF